MSDKKGYTGKVQHTGSQKIEAPNANTGKKGQTSVIKGNDIRAGKK